MSTMLPPLQLHLTLPVWVHDLALAASPTRAQSADAAVLAADAAMVEGKSADAIDLYLAAHSAYPDLLAGETALFAAARLAARRADTPRARELMQQYLDAYPQGTFSAEAAKRLRALPR